MQNIKLSNINKILKIRTMSEVKSFCWWFLTPYQILLILLLLYHTPHSIYLARYKERKHIECEVHKQHSEKKPKLLCKTQNLFYDVVVILYFIITVCSGKCNNE